MVAENRRTTVIAQYGSIRIRQLEDAERSLPLIEQLQGAAKSLHIYNLSPSEIIAAELSEGFQLRMLCVTDKENTRRFYPLNGFDGLIADCAAGGLAILTHLRELNSESRFSYRVMIELCKKVQGMSEHYKRNFRGVKDLIITPTGRDDMGQRDVLPESLGKDRNGNGRHWGIRSLKKAGRIESEKLEYRAPSEATIIELGLFAAAKMNPLRIDNSSEVEKLVQAALYEGPPDVSLKEADWIELKSEITEKMLAIIEKRLNKTTEGFEEWLSGPKNSLTKLIANRKCSQGKISKAMARRATLELGWQGYQYLADCVRVQMRCFRNALQNELNTQELELFDQLYMPHDSLGGLPLVLLQERTPFLKAPILAQLRGEQFDVAGVIHRLLFYYIEMIGNRRPADSRSQAYSKMKSSLGRSPQIYQFDENRPIEDNGNRHVKRKAIYENDNQEWDR